jgi:glutathione S-transferase
MYRVYGDIISGNCYKVKLLLHLLDIEHEWIHIDILFVGEHYSIADIALYAYTHVAPAGGFDLQTYPAVCSWLERVAAQPRHRSMADFSEP